MEISINRRLIHSFEGRNSYYTLKLWSSETPKLSSIQVPEESRKLSSFFVHRSSKIKPQRPFGSTIIHQFKIKPRRPLKKVFFVLRSSFIVLPRSSPDDPWINKPPFFKIKPKSLWRSVHHCSSRSSPKALENPFITVIQDQALTALEETFILKIKPQRLLEDPLKSTFKDQAHGPLKKLPNSSSKIKPQRPLKKH